MLDEVDMESEVASKDQQQQDEAKKKKVAAAVRTLKDAIQRAELVQQKLDISREHLLK